jgi:hypothetical protein
VEPQVADGPVGNSANQAKVLCDALAQARYMARQVRLRLLDQQWKLRVEVVRSLR